MNQSDNLDQIVVALNKTQSEMPYARKDSSNPFHKSKYADLVSCWEACKDVMTKNGLSISQGGRPCENGMILVTKLFHISGQWISSEMPIAFMMPPDKNHAQERRMNSQEIGSAIKYFRRYSLCAILSICDDDFDDDANSASNLSNKNKTNPSPAPAPSPGPKITSDKAVHLSSMLSKCSKEFSESITAYMRNAPINASAIQDLPASHYDAIIGHINKHLAEAMRKNAA